MAIKNITSTNPIKAKVVKQFKDIFSASKVTNVKFDTVDDIFHLQALSKKQAKVFAERYTF